MKTALIGSTVCIKEGVKSDELKPGQPLVIVSQWVDSVDGIAFLLCDEDGELWEGLNTDHFIVDTRTFSVNKVDDASGPVLS